MSSDSFTGSGNLSSPWVVVTGQFNQTGGVCYGDVNSTSSYAAYDENLGTDHECSVTVNPGGSGQFIGPTVRGSKVAFTCANVDAGSDGMYVNTWAAGTPTTLEGPISFPGAPVVLRLVAQGDDLLFYIGGSLHATYTGALAGMTDVNAGITSYSNGTTTGAADWSSQANGGGGGGTTTKGRKTLLGVGG